MTVSQRRPYVGECADGCYRSAQIAREEATLDDLDTRRDELYTSAEAWERQAEHLEQHPPRRPESERRGAAPHASRPAAPGRDSLGR